jgi:hypothetical protein
VEVVDRINNLDKFMEVIKLVSGSPSESLVLHDFDIALVEPLFEVIQLVFDMGCLDELELIDSSELSLRLQIVEILLVVIYYFRYPIRVPRNQLLYFFVQIHFQLVLIVRNYIRLVSAFFSLFMVALSVLTNFNFESMG